MRAQKERSRPARLQAQRTRRTNAGTRREIGLSLMG
jgi:hypothetical protein